MSKHQGPAPYVKGLSHPMIGTLRGRSLFKGASLKFREGTSIKSLCTAILGLDDRAREEILSSGGCWTLNKSGALARVREGQYKVMSFWTTEFKTKSHIFLRDSDNEWYVYVNEVRQRNGELVCEGTQKELLKDYAGRL
jgi:hypothetical protein